MNHFDTFWLFPYDYLKRFAFSISFLGSLIGSLIGFLNGFSAGVRGGQIWPRISLTIFRTPSQFPAKFSGGVWLPKISSGNGDGGSIAHFGKAGNWRRKRHSIKFWINFQKRRLKSNKSQFWKKLGQKIFSDTPGELSRKQVFDGIF